MVNEERYKSVVEDQTEIICRFYPDGTFIFVNDVYCRFFGKSQEELIGKQWFPEAHQDDLNMINEKLNAMTMQNPVVLIENRVFSGYGELQWMQFVNRGFYDKNGKLLEIQSVGRNITERKLVENKLEESEERLSNFINEATDGFILFDADLNHVEMNKAALEITGLDRATVIGKNILDVVPDIKYTGRYD